MSLDELIVFIAKNHSWLLPPMDKTDNGKAIKEMCIKLIKEASNPNG